jgi:putative membrane protein insertion efficiency factor
MTSKSRSKSSKSQSKTGAPSRDRRIPKGVYHEDPSLSELPKTIWNMPRYLFLLLIRGYQVTFSKTLPVDSCRFYPSCSHYGYTAIYKYGLLKGGLMAAWRILRCNPFNPGGYDPVK